MGRTDGATISGCVVKDDVTIGYATGNVTCHGGIVGNIINGGLVIGCVSKATINGSDSNTNGNELFGGIAGQNNGGTIRDCLYTGSTVQGKQYIGAIVGNSSGGTLTNNYYTSSTVPCGVNSNDQNGARRAWTVTLGEDVVLVGDETAYVSGITAIGSGNYALSYNDGTTATLYSGEGQTLTLYYTGDISGHILSYSYNDGSEHAIDGNSFTMPGANVSVSAILTPVYALTFDEDGITTTTPPAVTDNGIGYYAAGTEIILDYIIPTGYDFRNFRRDGYLVGNSFTMPSQDVTVSVYKTPQWGINNGKDGSQAKPYVISDLYDLNVLAMSVNGTDGAAHYVANDFEGKYFQVDKDISYDEKTENNFTAIGTASHPFKGTFDGNNKVVKNIRINRGDDDYQGLFGYVGTGGTVQNVIVEAAIIAGKSHTGAIAGYNEGTLSANYYLDSEVNTAAVNVGTGSGDVTGALSMHMIIPGEGVVVSGSVHFYILTFSSSFDTGDDYYAQGSTVTLSPAEGYLLGSGGYTVTKEGTNETVAVTETETAGVYTFTMPACKVIVSPIVPDIATYWHADTDHDGTSEERAYIISTTTGLNMLANHVYDGHNCKGLFFRLGADIAYDPSAADANGINFLGIGGDYGTGVGMFFNGTFDGQGYTISGTRIHRTADNVGLFGAIGSGGTVKNVTLTDARITGGNSTGGIAGSNTGTIKNCIVVGTTIIKEYRDHYGVIVGMNSGIISNNYYLGCTYIDGNNSKTSSIGLGDNDEDFDYSGHDQDDDDGALETEAFPLLSSGNNDRAISKYNGVANQDFTLAGRTLYKDGDWNTLCLPFSLSAEQIAAHEYFKDVDIRAFSSASFSNGTLTLNFTAQGDVTSIQAGTPYIIKWTKADDYDEGYNHAIYDIRNGTFKKVTITSTTPGAVTSAGGKVTFQGTYSYIQYTNEDRSVLFLGTQNKLYWPLPALFDPTKPYDELWNPWVYPNIGAFRAYFQLNGLTAGDPNAPGLNIVLNFGETTSLSEKGIVNSEKFATAEEWYTVNGVKLSGKPTQKGVYIFGNKQVVIK